MIVQCDSCQAKYKIADEKVKGKAVKIRCAKCSHVFTVKPPEAETPMPIPPAPSPAKGGIEVPDPPTGSPATPEEATPPKPAPEPAAPSGLPPIDIAPETPPADSGPGPSESRSPDDLIGTYQPPIAGDENIPFGQTPPGTPAPKDEMPPIGGREPSPPETETSSPDIGLPPSGTDIGLEPPEPGGTTLPDSPLGSPPEPATPEQAEPADAPGDMDWGNIALDKPAAEEEDPSDFGLAGGDEYQPPRPPPPVPMEASEPSPLPGPGHYDEPIVDQPAVPTYQPHTDTKRGGGKGFLLFIIILGLAAAGYYFGYPKYLEWQNGKTLSEGVELSITNQTATAIKRDDGNVLSVVRGQVKNGLDKSVGLVEVAATFLGPGDQVLGQASSFCGNQFSDEELRTGDLQKINSDLQYELGQAMSNNSIKPGATVPFLILLENSSMNIKKVSVTVKGYKETT